MHTRYTTSRRRPAQAGDTIVEVIIAVAVIATLLAGAFTVTSRSARGVRDSEEHAQALQYLQGQVEQLRAAAGNGTLPASLSTPFCMDTADSSIYYQPATTDTHCTLGSLYQVSITGPGASPGSGTSTFDLTASWSAFGGGTDTVSLTYKVVVAS